MTTVVCGKSSMSVVNWRYSHDALKMCSGITFALVQNSDEFTGRVLNWHQPFVWFAITPSNGVPSVPLNQVLGLQWLQCVTQHLHPAFATFPLYAVLLVIARSVSFGAQGVVHSPSGSDLGSVSGCFANFPLLHLTICGWLAISVLCLRSTHKCTDSVHALFVVSHCLASEQQTSTFLFWYQDVQLWSRHRSLSNLAHMERLTRSYLSLIFSAL